MRYLSLSVACLAMLAAGCDGGTAPPTAPSTIIPASTPAPPAPTPSPALPNRFTEIALGEAVSSRVTKDDPLCDEGWHYRCGYYRVTAPGDGILDVTMRWSSADAYPLDIDVLNSHGGRLAVHPQVGPGERRVAFRATAHEVYFIEVWSFMDPGVEFELRTSFRP